MYVYVCLYVYEIIALQIFYLAHRWLALLHGPINPSIAFVHVDTYVHVCISFIYVPMYARHRA
jgi:hypothetical protein